MSFDAHANLAYSTIAVGPAPANSGTSLDVHPGQGALFPAAPFNCTVWPAGVVPLASNAEIIRVTLVVGDTFTIVRAQEGTSAINIVAGFQISNSTSVKVFTDIENSIIQFISAGTTKAGASEVVFADSNNISFGADNGSITASFGGGGGIGISAGANSQNTGVITFSNTNNVTFGLDGAGVLTAQAMLDYVAVPGLTQVISNTLLFSDGNGVTFGLDSPALGVGRITASVNGITSQSNQAASASNGSFTFQTLSFTDANGVTFGTSAGGIIFASVAANPGQSVQPVAASATNGSFLFSTLKFTDANGVTFGTSAGGIIFASVNTAAAQTNPGASASNGSFSFQTLNFSDANGITFGTSAGGIITASYNSTSAPAQATATQWEPYPLNGASVLISHGASLVQLYDPMFLPCALSFNSIRLLISASNSFAASASTDLSNAQTRTFNFAIFSRSNSNSTHADFNKIVTYASIAYTMQITTSGTGASIKRATVGWQTDSTGGSTTNTFSTSSAAMQMAGFNSRMILNIPWATTLSAGQWFIGAHTNAPIGAGQDAFIIGNYQCSWIGNSTIRSGLGDTGIGNANNNNAYLVGFGGHSNNSATSMITSFSLPTDVVFVQPDFMHRRWYAFV